MNLSSPITLQHPSITRPDGEVWEFPTFTLTSLDITIWDNPQRKMCMVRIERLPMPLTLWTGESYDAAGDYTQAQVEARVLELLGPDLKAGLEKLFTHQPV